ncbi:G-protein coupled receptor family C group 6 member A-like [Latimeria chalumnae]|uniref:G-protein coupled receptor family C group 6 member A-like n=1 Tax=Latimeria chalumnae TaxID=7897 RepID=UPI00313D5094
MPQVDELIERLGKAKYLPTLDLTKDYWQLPLTETAKEKTIFSTLEGLYQYTVMPFGLHGAPATFQRLMDRVLRPHRQYVAAYLDGVVIYSGDWDSHLQQVEAVLNSLRDFGFMTNPVKCHIGLSETKYLGYTMGGGVVRPQIDKVEAIKTLPKLINKKQVTTFWGIIGYYRWFLPNFATQAAALTDMIKAKAPNMITWTPEADAAFQDLSTALCGALVFFVPDFNRNFVLQTDASNMGLGVVLSQEFEGEEHLVLYLSRKLLPREQRYVTVEKECLALKWATETLRYYLLGCRFMLVTDHTPLRWMRENKDKNAHIAQWFLSLQPFCFDVEHQIPHSVCSESCPPGYRKASCLGEPICCFDCIPCSIGEISNQMIDATECLKCPDDQWSNELQDQCIPKAVEFLAYEDAMGATLAVLSIFCALVSMIVLCIFIKYRNTPIVKANNRELSYILLLSLVLCFLSSLLFIGKPKTWSCMLRQVAFGIIFALSVSCVLAKTIMVVIAFNATKPNSKLRKWVGAKLAISIVLICTIIQIIICIVWLARVPPFPTENMESQIGKIILECNEGSTTAFWCMMGYMGLLAIVSFIEAFLARNLPGSFNEAKFITFSMLVFVTVWLAFIPAYLSTRGKYMVAVEIFAILASTAGLLACIFSPKCYIILLRPDMNNKESLMGKGKLITKNVT